MAWYDTDYKYRKRIKIDAQGTELNDYQMVVILHKGIGTDGSPNANDVYLNNHCRPDFNDIRLTQSDGETLLDHWRQKCGLEIVQLGDVFADGQEDRPPVWYPDTPCAYTFGGQYAGNNTVDDILKWIPGNNPIHVADLDATVRGSAAVYAPVTGKCYIYGGEIDGSTHECSDEIYWYKPSNNTTDTCSDTYPAEKLPADMHFSSAVYHPTQEVIYIFGGVDYNTNYQNKIWKHDPVAHTVTEISGQLLEDPMAMMVAVYVPDNDCIYLFGGFKDLTGSVDYIQKFDCNAETISTLGATCPYEAENPAGYYNTSDDLVYIFGGCDRWVGGTYHDDIWTFDPSDDTTIVTLDATILKRQDDFYGIYDIINNKGYLIGTLPSGSADNDVTKQKYICEFAPLAVFWVEFDTIPASGSGTFYIYYGKSGGASDSSGADTFIVFDDFTGNLLVGSGGLWTVKSGTWAIDANRLKYSAGTKSNIIYTQTTVPTNYRTAAKLVNNANWISGAYPAIGDYVVDDYFVGGHKQGKAGVTGGIGSIIVTSEDAWSVDQIAGVTPAEGQIEEFTKHEDDIVTTLYTSNWVEREHRDRTHVDFEQTGKFATHGYGGRDSWLGWIFLAKYISPEPTWGTWGSEEPLMESSVSIGLEASATGVRGFIREAAVSVGLLASATVSSIQRILASVTVGISTSATRIFAITRSAATSVGLVASAFIKILASTIVGFFTSATRTITVTRKAIVVVGSVASATRVVEATRNAAVITGLAVSALGTTAIRILAAVSVGIVTSASRVVTITRESATIIGLLAIASRIIEITKEGVVQIGLVVSASAQRIFTTVLASVSIGLVAVASRTADINRVATTIVGLVVSVSGSFIEAGRYLTIKITTAQHRSINIITAMYRKIRIHTLGG